MKIGIIGCGSMGKMILEKFIKTNTVLQSNIYVSNRTLKKIMDLDKIYPKINICKNNIDAVKYADIVFICVKPLEIKNVLLEINSIMKDNCHVISLNGSVLLEQIEQICPNKKVSKIMPSIMAEINQSVTLICHNNYVNDCDKSNINRLLECFGTVTAISEMEMGMGSELTSCMPGFIGAIFKIIVDEAEKHTTIDKQQIIQMVVQTIYGTGKLLLKEDMTFEQLIERVATKGGITEEGVKIFEEKLPMVINEMFIKTLEKRKITTEKAQKIFFE